METFVTHLPSGLMTLPSIGAVNTGLILAKSVIFAVFLYQAICSHPLAWFQPYISTETFKLKEPIYQRKNHMYFGMPS